MITLADGRCSRCGVSVASDDVWARAGVAVLSFRDVGAPRYDLGRSTVAIAVCFALVALALWLWRRTDWSSPSEAATPELDAAQLE